MAKTEFKLVRKPASPNVQKKIIRDEVIAKLKPVAKAAKESYDKIVSNWNNKPGFKDEIKVTSGMIEIIISVRRGQRLKDSKSGKTTADLWKWLNTTGTKSHAIRPKAATGKLRFNWGGKGSYQSKTGANPARYGGPGTVTGGQIVYRKQVQHPGFPPRHFSNAINQDLKPKFNQAIDSGYRAGMRKAKKANG